MPAIKKPTDTKDLAGFKEFFTGLQSQFASAATLYEGPLKSLYEETVTKLNGVLTGLKEAGENWNLTDKLDWLFDSMASTSALLSNVTLELQKAKADKAAADALEATRASAADALTAAVGAGTHLTKAAHDAAVTAAVTAAIAERTGEKGDLTPRAQVNSLCSAAKDLGIAEGRKLVEDELAAKAAADKLVADRKAALTTAGLPLPEATVEAVLRAPEKEFTAAQTLVVERQKGFTEAGIDLSPELAASLWLPADQFNIFNTTVRGVTALKRTTGRPASPFATGIGEPTAGSGKRMVG
jgi:hypothetical protein